MNKVTIYRSWTDIISTLPEHSQGKLYQAIFRYAFDNDEISLPDDLQKIFVLIQPQIAFAAARKAKREKQIADKLSTNCQQKAKRPQKATCACADTRTDLEVNSINLNSQRKDNINILSKRKTLFDLFPEHLQTAALKVKWQEWEEYRRKTKRTLSELAAKKQISMLQHYCEEEIITIIDTSISNDYQGLFPLRGGANKPKRKDYTDL